MTEFVTQLKPLKYEVSIARVGPQGSKGTPGDPGLSSSSSLEAIANSNISGHKAVMYDSAGQVQVADSTILSNMNRVIGITTGAVVTGATATIQGSGSIDHAGWSFTPNAPVFLGLSGTLTQSLPPGTLFVLPIGVATSATRLSINIQSAIQLA